MYSFLANYQSRLRKTYLSTVLYITGKIYSSLHLLISLSSVFSLLPKVNVLSSFSNISFLILSVFCQSSYFCLIQSSLLDLSSPVQAGFQAILELLLLLYWNLPASLCDQSSPVNSGGLINLRNLQFKLRNPLEASIITAPGSS